MALDDTTWIITSLPRAAADEVPPHTFRSLLSPWRRRQEAALERRARLLRRGRAGAADRRWRPLTAAS